MIPLVRARYSGNFIDVVRKTGAQVGRVLDDAGLAEEVLEVPNGLTTIWQLGEVARSSAIRTGNLDIGWAAAEAAPLESYGSFAERILIGPTLIDRLNAFCAAACDEYSEATFSVVRRRDSLHFKRGPIIGDEISARQTELYVISLMLRTIRSVLGPSWHPGQILFQTFHRPETEAHFDTSRTELRFDHPETVIVIDDADVVRSLGGSGQPDVGNDLRDLSFDTQHALAELIDAYLGDHRLSLEFMARICDTHPRALQRMLASQRTSFSNLLVRQRITAAMKRLKDSDMPIAELSYLLGYTHQAHFSRAFRRHTGFTPIGYRRTASRL